MNFDLDDDEHALQQGIRELCRGRAASERVRRAADTGGVDRELLRELGEAGVFALTIPEEVGGLGLGATHATVVFEELGRALVPGPVVATHLAATLGVDGAAGGTTVVTAVLPGSPIVAHLDGVDQVVLVGTDDVRLARAAEVADSAAPVRRPLDPLTPLHRLAGSLPDGEPIGDGSAAEACARRGRLLTSALLLGNALGSLELATRYAKQREQFGRPVGSFQAVKHLLADALTRAEVARAAVYAAACHLDDPDLGDVDTALASAALLVADAAIKNGKTSIQVHGGMGFTWEVDAHLYLKRAVVLAAAVDGVAANEARMAETM